MQAFARRIAFALILGAALVAPGAAVGLRASETVAFEPYVGQLKTITVSIDGQPAHMLFDTGAGVTSMTPEFARRIGCEPWGSVTAFRMNGERVSFQRCPQTPVAIATLRVRRDVAVFDINALLPEGLPRLDGVAGLDLFDGETITLLHGLSGLRIESARSRRAVTRGLRAGRIRISRESGGAGLTVFAPASTPRGEIWLLLDSANLAGVRLSPPARAALGGQDRVALSVDGVAIAPLDVEVVPDLIYDGALSARIIAGYNVTIDLAEQRIWWRVQRSFD